MAVAIITYPPPKIQTKLIEEGLKSEALMERRINQLNTYLPMDGSYFVDHVFLAQNMDCTESCTSHIGTSEYRELHREPNEDIVKILKVMTYAV